jgi:hypothetical protein
MPCPNEARKRCMTISFRVTPEQAKHLDVLVAASGMTKQDYIVAKLTDETVVVQPSTRVYKALKGAMRNVYLELSRIATGCPADAATVATVAVLANEFIGLRGATAATQIEQETVQVFDMERM